MRLAYIDTSCLVAIGLSEPGHQKLARDLRRCDRIFSSSFLEAEFRAVLAREGIDEPGTDLLDWIDWVFPDRRLTREITTALEAGYLRGADLWHISCALYLQGHLPGLRFVSADSRQLAVARHLGLA